MQKIEIEMTKRFDLPFEWTDRSCRRKFERLLPQNQQTLAQGNINRIMLPISLWRCMKDHERPVCFED